MLLGIDLFFLLKASYIRFDAKGSAPIFRLSEIREKIKCEYAKGLQQRLVGLPRLPEKK